MWWVLFRIRITLDPPFRTVIRNAFFEANSCIQCWKKNQENYLKYPKLFFLAYLVSIAFRSKELLSFQDSLHSCIPKYAYYHTLQVGLLGNTTLYHPDLSLLQYSILLPLSSAVLRITER